MKKLKIGLDLHGVSDKLPDFFSEMSRLFIEAGHEIHIMTGELITPKLHEQLENCNIHYTHLFSISQHHKDIGTKMWFDENNTPWIDKDLWNETKGKYAEEHGLDITFDDTEIYAEYFRTPFVFVRIKN